MKDSKPTVTCRVSKDDRTLMIALAELDGKSLSEWVHDIIVPIAHERVKELTTESATKQIDVQIAELETQRRRRIEIIERFSNG